METLPDVIMATPPDSLLVGSHSTVDSNGNKWSAGLIHGTPTGFRMLAGVLIRMADTIESPENDTDGWHLALSPDDIEALRTINVRNLDLTCRSSIEELIRELP